MPYFTPNNRTLYASRDAGRSIIGGHIFIYSRYAQLISFEIEIKILKSIVFTVCKQEYMNMCPSPQLSIFRRPCMPEAFLLNFLLACAPARCLLPDAYLASQKSPRQSSEDFQPSAAKIRHYNFLVM